MDSSHNVTFAVPWTNTDNAAPIKDLMAIWRNLFAYGYRHRHLWVSPDVLELAMKSREVQCGVEFFSLGALEPVQQMAHLLNVGLGDNLPDGLIIDVIDGPEFPKYSAIWTHESWADAKTRHGLINSPTCAWCGEIPVANKGDECDHCQRLARER